MTVEILRSRLFYPLNFVRSFLAAYGSFISERQKQHRSGPPRIKEIAIYNMQKNAIFRPIQDSIQDNRPRQYSSKDSSLLCTPHRKFVALKFRRVLTNMK